MVNMGPTVTRLASVKRVTQQHVTQSTVSAHACRAGQGLSVTRISMNVAVSPVQSTPSVRTTKARTHVLATLDTKWWTNFAKVDSGILSSFWHFNNKLC